MPTPSRTSTAEIVTAGPRILEAEGLDGPTMQRVAAAVGVRAPSRYKRVSGRSEPVLASRRTPSKSCLRRSMQQQGAATHGVT